MEIFCCKRINDELNSIPILTSSPHCLAVESFLVIVAVGVSKGAGILGLVQHSVSHTQGS